MKTTVKKVLSILSISLLALVACEKDTVKPRDPGANGGGGGGTPTENPYLLKGRIDKRTTLTNHRSGFDYEISGVLTIADELFIEEGTEIVLLANSRIDIRGDGSITAIGTEDEPITLRGKVASEGYWETIIVESNNPANIFEYVNISDGGGRSSNHYASVYIGSGAQLSLKNSSINNSKEYGLYVANGSLPNFSNNSFNKNGNSPIRIPFSNITDLDSGSDYGDDNYSNTIAVSGNANSQNKEIQNLNVPYELFGVSNISGDLEIAAGTQFTMSAGARLTVSTNGSLKAIGTASEMISFKGKAAAPGYWELINIESNNPNNQFEYVEVKHGGSRSSNHYASIYVTSNGGLNMTNSSVSDSYGWGLYVANGANMTPATKTEMESQNTFSNNGSGSNASCNNDCDVRMD